MIGQKWRSSSLSDGFTSRSMRRSDNPASTVSATAMASSAAPAARLEIAPENISSSITNGLSVTEFIHFESAAGHGESVANGAVTCGAQRSE